MDGPKRTEFAMQAVDLAEMFRLVVGATQLTGNETYTVELSAPDGPSTGGGKQAVQHIKLVPAQGNVVVVVGSANQLEKTAKLRSFDHVAAQYRSRFKGAQLPVDPGQYNQLLQTIQSFFTQQELTVSREVMGPELVQSDAATLQSTRGGLPLMPLAIVLVGIIAGLLSYLLLK